MSDFEDGGMCPECGGYWYGSPRCPNCGHEPGSKMKRTIEMTEQERLQALEIMTEHLRDLESLPNLDAEAWLLFTGMPGSTQQSLMQCAMKQGWDIFEVMTVVAAIAYTQGRKEATQAAKSASESKS